MSFSFCVIMCYQIFLVSAAASVGAKRTSTGCPAPLYLPLSEFINTDEEVLYMKTSIPRIIGLIMLFMAIYTGHKMISKNKKIRKESILLENEE